jgi:hypothetical protein
MQAGKTNGKTKRKAEIKIEEEEPKKIKMEPKDE